MSVLYDKDMVLWSILKVFLNWFYTVYMTKNKKKKDVIIYCDHNDSYLIPGEACLLQDFYSKLHCVMALRIHDTSQ